MKRFSQMGLFVLSGLLCPLLVNAELTSTGLKISMDMRCEESLPKSFDVAKHTILKLERVSSHGFEPGNTAVEFVLSERGYQARLVENQIVLTALENPSAPPLTLGTVRVGEMNQICQKYPRASGASISVNLSQPMIVRKKITGKCIKIGFGELPEGYDAYYSRDIELILEQGGGLRLKRGSYNDYPTKKKCEAVPLGKEETETLTSSDSEI